MKKISIILLSILSLPVVSFRTGDVELAAVPGNGAAI